MDGVVWLGELIDCMSSYLMALTVHYVNHRFLWSKFDDLQSILIQLG